MKARLSPSCHGNSSKLTKNWPIPLLVRIERLGFLDRPTMEEAYRALKALNVILKALETKIEIDPPQLGEEVLYRSFLNNVDRFLVVVDWGQLAYENFEVQIDVEDTAARVNEVGQLLEK